MSGISHEEETGSYVVTLAGAEVGRFTTRSQALRALEHGTGHTLGSPFVYGGSRDRSRTTPRAPEVDLTAPATVTRGRNGLPWTDASALKAAKVDSPETFRQAQRWDSAVIRYSRAGLCGPCASQAAWAGQIGYSRVRPPCEECAPIVADFPGAEHVNGWRSWPERTVFHRPRRDSVSA